MPRRGENIYKRKDGRWEGRYIRGRTPAGKAEYGYVYAKSYAACREKQRKMEGNIPQKSVLTGEMSVDQAVEFFLSDRRGELKASTIGRYEYMANHYVIPELGVILLRDLTAEKLSAYFKRLQDKGLSSKTARDIGVLLKTIFKVVKKKCHCDCPGRDVELPAYRGKKVEVFADHEIALLAQNILEKPDITGLCILLVLNTGLRLGEVCALRKSDIDYRSGFLRIERSAARVRDASGTHLVVQSPKSDSSVRLVAIPNDMLELLKATTQNIQRDNYLLTNTDTPMEPRTMQYRYRKLLERCGIRYRNFHAMRHPYVKHTTKIFSLRLMDFQAQAYPDARRKTRGACQLLRVGQSRSPVRPLYNRKRFSCLPPQSKMSWILYAISMRLSGYTSTRSISISASSVVSASASKIALDASFRLSCRACSSCFCFACANTAA